jgi:hypothetical protein
MGTIVHKSFPEAWNFPSLPGARRAMRNDGSLRLLGGQDAAEQAVVAALP